MTGAAMKMPAGLTAVLLVMLAALTVAHAADGKIALVAAEKLLWQRCAADRRRPRLGRQHHEQSRSGSAPCSRSRLPLIRQIAAAKIVVYQRRRL